LEKLPEPYKSVRLQPNDSHGWYKPGNKKGIEWIFKKHKIDTVIEVGVWMGLSARHTASLLPPGGKLYAVDPWYGIDLPYIPTEDDIKTGTDKDFSTN